MAEKLTPGTVQFAAVIRVASPAMKNYRERQDLRSESPGVALPPLCWKVYHLEGLTPRVGIYGSSRRGHVAGGKGLTATGKGTRPPTGLCRAWWARILEGGPQKTPRYLVLLKLHEHTRSLGCLLSADGLVCLGWG